MVQPQIVEEQLRRIGANFKFWNKPELRELPKILFEGEEINHVVSGHYEGGFAILVSTNLRIILIDKKPLFLTLEDIRYERISDVELNHRLLDATLRLGALTKNLSFTGYNPARMRAMTLYIQERVMLSRQGRNEFVAGIASDAVTQPVRMPSTQALTVARSTRVEATNEQQEAIGQVALTASDSTIPASQLNPYRSPLMFKRRVSRFY